MKNLILVFIISMLLASCGVKKELWDNHCHLFSDALYDHMKRRTKGSEYLIGHSGKYSNIDSILLNNSADKVVLISTGYAYTYNRHR